MIRFKNTTKYPVSLNLLLADGRFKSLYLKAKGESEETYPDDVATRGEPVKLVRDGRIAIIQVKGKASAPSPAPAEIPLADIMEDEKKSTSKKGTKKEVKNGE